jgi:hypothetical protein
VFKYACKHGCEGIVSKRLGSPCRRRTSGGRHSHFMLASLLLSQIDTLEEPDPREDPLTVDAGQPAGQIAEEIIRLLGATALVRPILHIFGVHGSPPFTQG